MSFNSLNIKVAVFLCYLIVKRITDSRIGNGTVALASFYERENKNNFFIKSKSKRDLVLSL